MQRKILACTVAALALFALPRHAQAYDIDCKIILCLPAGFPSGCGDAYKTFIDRITARPPKPPIGHCPFGSASDVEIPTTREEAAEIIAGINDDDDRSDEKLEPGRPAIDQMKSDLLDSAETTIALLDRTMETLIERGGDEDLIREIRAQRDDAIPQAHRMAESLESVRCTHYWYLTQQCVGKEQDTCYDATKTIQINGDGSGFSMPVIRGQFKGSQCVFRDIDGATRMVGDATTFHVIPYNCYTYGRDDSQQCSYRTFWGPLDGMEVVDIQDDGGS